MTSSRNGLPSSEPAQRVRLILGAVASAGLIGLLAGMLPARARLIGLFGPAEGALLCLLLVEVLQRMTLNATRAIFITALLCGSAAFALTSALWWREFAVSVRAEFRVPPPNFFASQLSTTSESPAQPVDAEKLHEMKLLQQSFENDPDRAKELAARCSFPGYLVFRVFGIANSERIRNKEPAAIAFWLCELAASGLVCGLLFRRNVRASLSDAPVAVE